MKKLKLILDSAIYIKKKLVKRKSITIQDLSGNRFNYKGFVIYLDTNTTDSKWIATDFEAIQLIAVDLESILKKVDKFS